MRSKRPVRLAAAAAALLAGGCAVQGHKPAVAVQTVKPSVPLAGDPGGRGDGLYQRAVAALKARDYGAALDYLQAARQVGGDDVRVLNGLGVVYDKLGRFDLSKRYYEQAAALDPSSDVVRANQRYSQLLQARSGEGLSSPVIALAEIAPPTPQAAPATPQAAPARAAPARAEGPPPQGPVLRRAAADPTGPLRFVPDAPGVTRLEPAVMVDVEPAAPALAALSSPAPTPPARAEAPPPAETAPVPEAAPSTPPPAAEPVPAVATAEPPAAPAPTEATSVVARREAETVSVTPAAQPEARPLTVLASLQVDPPATHPALTPDAPAAAVPERPRASSGATPRDRTATAAAPPAVPLSRVGSRSVQGEGLRVVSPPASSGLIVVAAPHRRYALYQTKGRLASAGWTVRGRTVATGRPVKRSVITYPEGKARLALALARTLPFKTRLTACRHQCVAVTLALGADADRFWRGRRMKI